MTLTPGGAGGSDLYVGTVQEYKGELFFGGYWVDLCKQSGYSRDEAIANVRTHLAVEEENERRKCEAKEYIEF